MGKHTAKPTIQDGAGSATREYAIDLYSEQNPKLIKGLRNRVPDRRGNRRIARVGI